MHYSDYMREETARFRQQAAAAVDPTLKRELLEYAEICEEVADQADRLRASG